MRALNWKTIIALVLFLPVFEYCDLPLLKSTAQLAEHYALIAEHCEDNCPHPVSLIEKPQPTSAIVLSLDEPHPHELLLAELPHDHVARDRSPPLFYSLSHSLRAPPSLIPA